MAFTDRLGYRAGRSCPSGCLLTRIDRKWKLAAPILAGFSPTTGFSSAASPFASGRWSYVETKVYTSQVAMVIRNSLQWNRIQTEDRAFHSIVMIAEETKQEDGCYLSRQEPPHSESMVEANALHLMPIKMVLHKETVNFQRSMSFVSTQVT